MASREIRIRFEYTIPEWIRSRRQLLEFKQAIHTVVEHMFESELQEKRVMQSEHN